MIHASEIGDRNKLFFIGIHIILFDSHPNLHSSCRYYSNKAKYQILFINTQNLTQGYKKRANELFL